LNVAKYFACSRRNSEWWTREGAETSVAGEEDGREKGNETEDETKGMVEKGREGKGREGKGKETTGKAQGRRKPGSS